ncbi:hypothetical protein HanPI659440_Chr12g0466641 [Helianthus annuus]|nr:hypothetical protein HanPI659440_Chr12g0466641 [Helianthus annuus]
MSALNTNIFRLTFFAHPTISFITKGPSIIFLPETKADWELEITLFKTFFIRFASTFEMILLTTPIKEIGLKSEKVIGSVTLGMSDMKDELHV